MDCTWTLTASPGRKIVIDPFEINIEKCPKDDKKPKKCTCDYLVIETRKGENSLQSGPNKECLNKKCCGTKSVPKIESEENFLSLRFHSDPSGNFKGFKLKYHIK